MSDIDGAILKQEILSLLVSAKDGISERDLLNDYRMFNSNQDIPYRDLGFSSLIALLRTWPDVCRFRQLGNGQMQILAVEEENTKHILSMVRGQRPGKTKRRKYQGKNRNRGGREGDRYLTRDNRGGKFSQSTTNYNHNNNRRMMSNNNRFNSSSQSRTTSNNDGAPRFVKQQQQIRTYLQSQFYDDRRVINNSTSLKVTVGNPNPINEDYPNTPETPYSLTDYELNEEEYDDREEEVINNIQNLLKEYPHGIRLLVLDNIYQKKFGKSLLNELKLANILLLQDYVDEFAEISRHDEPNGSCDHIIILRDPNQVAQTQEHLLQQITDSGIVPRTFTYANNLFSYINDARFQGFISDIDKNEHCIHVQPVRYQEHIETLMEELDSYYSSPISNRLLINELEAGLSCVTKYDGIYHRVFIKELDPYKCVLLYVDYGTTEEINRDGQQFKYLLKHFAELPAMCLACRLDDIFFLPHDTRWPENTYNEVYMLCQHGPFFIEPKSYLNGLLTIRILDADQRALNDIVIESKLAVKISDQVHADCSQTSTPHSAIDCLSRAVQCPLPPDTCSSSSDISTDNTMQLHQYKLVQINKQTCFYFIRSNNKPYIPCFNLARILNATESDILSDTLLPRIRFCQTNENCLVFDYFNQLSELHDCPHIKQRFLFLFELLSVQTYLEQYGEKYRSLIEILRQQNQTAVDPQFWSNNHTCQTTSNESDTERYNHLLARRRNILCNMLRTNDIHQSTIELESIENQLQQLIETMKLGSIPKQNPRFNPSSSSHTSKDKQTNKKTEKLRDLMQRCKKLINTILVLDDYVIVDDNITKYIQENLPLLNSTKQSHENEQLYEHYSNLLENLTLIVDNLRQQLPIGMPI